MTVAIEMSLLVYDRFVDRCDPFSKEYEILKAGVIDRRKKEGYFERVIEVHCSELEATALLDLAKHIYPAVVTTIQKAIANSRAS